MRFFPKQMTFIVDVSFPFCKLRKDSQFRLTWNAFFEPKFRQVCFVVSSKRLRFQPLFWLQNIVTSHTISILTFDWLVNIISHRNDSSIFETVQKTIIVWSILRALYQKGKLGCVTILSDLFEQITMNRDLGLISLVLEECNSN